MSDLFLTRQSYDDEDGKYVRIFRQDARGVDGHVLSAEHLNVPSNQLVKGRAPRSGHA